MDNKLINAVYSHLRNGRVKEALDDLYIICQSNSKRYLEEVASHITKIELIDGSDRAGLISFEEKLRLKGQISSAVLKLLIILENDGKDSSNLATSLNVQLNIEKQKRLEAESRLINLERTISNQQKKGYSKKIREHFSDLKKEIQIAELAQNVSAGDNYVIVLKETIGERRLPIIIGEVEAQSIAIAIEKMVLKRPLTHDFFKSTIEELGFNLKEVIIDALEKDIFYSKSIFFNNTAYLEVDCRVADALALAVRFNTPIFTYEKILDEAGVILDEK